MDQIRFTTSRRSCVDVILARVFVTVTRQEQLQTGPFHSAVDQQQGEDLLTSGNFNFSKSISSVSSGSINFFKFLSCISLFCLVQPDCVQLTCPSFLSIRSLIVSILNIPSLQPHFILILYANTIWPYLKTNNTQKNKSLYARISALLLPRPPLSPSSRLNGTPARSSLLGSVSFRLARLLLSLGFPKRGASFVRPALAFELRGFKPFPFSIAPPCTTLDGTYSRNRCQVVSQTLSATLSKIVLSKGTSTGRSSSI